MVKKLYSIFTNKDGQYALKLDNDWLVRTDDSVVFDKYNLFVRYVKVEEIDNDKELLDLLKARAVNG